MAVFFLAQFTEFGGLLGMIFLQAVGEILVDAGVFFLQRDGQRQDFAFAETVEGSHYGTQHKQADVWCKSATTGGELDRSKPRRRGEKSDRIYRIYKIKKSAEGSYGTNALAV